MKVLKLPPIGSSTAQGYPARAEKELIGPIDLRSKKGT
ncbi:hypothetical protein J2Z31_005720 [Sinorhizobium kostiense]|uniref:Uncharacterized protein n=1 Tax=Sinorhizobium kostiense TaxID=76747 RepID=A0ABS4R910_9HYPH|nr:hypothetical protein [Sinorhizobium kostiense]